MLDELKGYLDTEWRTKKQCVDWLKAIFNMDVNERTFRLFVAEFNEKYESGEQEMFIAHSEKGYLLTSDQEIIMQSLTDDFKRAAKLMRRYYRCKKAIAEKKQLALEPQESDLYTLVSNIEL